jgi:hypothetical protein
MQLVLKCMEGLDGRVEMLGDALLALLTGEPLEDR